MRLPDAALDRSQCGNAECPARFVSQFPRRLTVVLLLWLLMMATLPTTFAQKGNKPGRGGQSGNKPPGGMQGEGRDRRDYELAAVLPPGYQHLQNDDVRQLEQLVLDALGWLRRNSAPVSGLESCVDQFQWSGNTVSVEARGLRILSLLTLEQRKTLASVLDDYRTLKASREEQNSVLVALLNNARVNATPALLRRLETDSRKPLQEIAGADAELGMLQSRVFLRIGKSLGPEQSEAILLASRSAAAPETATAEMQAVQGELRNTSADAARDLEELGVSFAEWLAPAAASGSVQQAAAADTERRGGGREKSVDAGVLEFLTALQDRQPELLLQLLAASARGRKEASAALLTLQTALRTGPGGRVPDERILRTLTEHRARLVFTAAIEEARGFESLRTSLSDVQKQHLNIKDTDKPKRKKSEGD